MESIGELAKKEKFGSLEQLNLLRLYHDAYRENIFEQIADNYAILKMRDFQRSING